MMELWEPIDTAPRDKTRVLLWRQQNPRGWLRQQMIIGYWTSGPSGNTYWSLDMKSGGAAQDADIWGWMPLPKPPFT